jgi:hypothetical protein
VKQMDSRPFGQLWYSPDVDDLTPILTKLERCVRDGAYESLETDWLEVKPVPATGHAWDRIRESVCAFLNARGGRGPWH